MTIEGNILKIKITLIEEMLGTKSANFDLFSDFIASKCEDDDKRKQELETAKHKEEAGTTIFHRDDDDELILWDYQIKGFLKAAADCIRQCNPTATNPSGPKKGKKWGSIRAKMDKFVLVSPRQIKLGKKEPDMICERPLRCETMQGPRVSVARSEVVKSGTSFECQIKVMAHSPVTMDMIREILDYGEWKGLGQWRNSGKGRFSWIELT